MRRNRARPATRGELEVGAASSGTSRAALESYRTGIGDVPANAGGALRRGARVVVVVNDRRDLYPEMLERAGLRLDERFHRAGRGDEEYGLYVERKGRLPRMAGRILAQLLIDEEPHLTQAGLREALQASAGAVSGMLRLLIEAGFARRVSIPGVRKDFYRLVDDSWGVSLAHGVEDTQQFTRIAELGVAGSVHFGALAQARLEEMRHLATISKQHARQLLDAWQEYKASHGPTPVPAPASPA